MLALAEIDSGLNSSEAAYSQIIFEAQREKIEEVRSAIKSGLQPGDLIGAKGAAMFRYPSDIRKRLLIVMANVKSFGMQQVRQELARQRP